MKLLRNKQNKNNTTNALEALLYAPTGKLPTRIDFNAQPYERGMLISISNNRTTYADIVKNYRAQYLSLLYALTGKNEHSKYDIKRVEGIPDKEILLELIHKKIPVMVCGVHDYRQEKTLYGGSLQSWEYQHQHLYVYGMHHHLDPDGRTTEMIQKIFNPRYTNNKKRIKDAVRITEVGTGKHIHTDPITPINLHEYLTQPVNNTLIHYISNNRHKPEVQYPLTTIYLTPTKNAI